MRPVLVLAIAAALLGSMSGGSASALPLGFCERLLGSGNGIAGSLLFCAGRGYDLIDALGHYWVLAFVWCAFAAAVYIGHGYHDRALMIPATAGSCLGGRLASRVARARGTRFVRSLFALAGTAFGLKLLLGY